MKIKFNHIQDLADARYASAALAEWIGFAIDGPKTLSLQNVQEIIGWCNGPKIILEVYETPNIDKIQAWINVIPVDGIECDADQLHKLHSHFPNMPEWIVRNANSILMNELESKTTYHSYSSPINLNPLILNISDTLHNFSTDDFSFSGFSLNCIKEIETGKKDFSDWNSLFEKIEIY